MCRTYRSVFLPLVAILVAFGFQHIHAQTFVYPVGAPNARPSTTFPNANGFKLTQAFDNESAHTGVDLANGTEGDVVRSISDGVVEHTWRTANSSGWGNAIVIRHNLGATTLYSLYAHLQEGSVLVSAGEVVDAGDIIGRVNCSGNTRGAPNCPSNGGHGSHLHFAIKSIGTLGCGYIGPACKSSDSLENYRSPLDVIADQQNKPSVPSAITVDGDPSDWTDVRPVVIDPIEGFPIPPSDPRNETGRTFTGLDIIQVSVTNDSSRLYFLIEATNSSVAQSNPLDGYLLHLDLDSNTKTGCKTTTSDVFGQFPRRTLGTEGIIVLLPPPFVYHLTDQRDCSGGPQDFPGAVRAAATGRFVEVSVTLAALQQLRSNISSLTFQLIDGVDVTDVGYYTLQ